MSVRVPSLSLRAQQQLDFTSGWLGLGDHDEAMRALSEVPESERNHPDVLAASWSLLAARDAWSKAYEVATQHWIEWDLDLRAWINRSYAMRRMPDGGLPRAYEALLPAHQRFPDDFLVPYNLACYECQLGHHEEAIDWIKKAVKQAGRQRILKLAESDSDLEPILLAIKRIQELGEACRFSSFESYKPKFPEKRHLRPGGVFSGKTACCFGVNCLRWVALGRGMTANCQDCPGFTSYRSREV